jgi:adenosylcobinamide kinase/adenosylcobinamide-phosphate guanylyltransferase
VGTAHDRSVSDRLILVTGGARSGKSTFAERLAAQLAEPGGGRVTYLATSETHDPEMAQRVAEHQSVRPASWTTIECPVEVPAAVRASASAAGTGAVPGSAAAPVFLLDCVTLWVTNLLFSGGAFGGSEPPSDGYNYDKDLLPADAERAAAGRVTAAVDDLLVALGESGATLVAVTNEVGLGVVPEYPLARLYRDQLGRANQRLARAAGRVCFLVSGYPLDVKALAAPFPAAPPFPPKESDQ